MTDIATEEGAAHDALIECNYICEGVEKQPGFREDIKCAEKHGSPAKTFKGKIILQPVKVSSKQIKMLCFKFLNKWVAEHRSDRKLKKKSTDKDQVDLFNMPDQKKYSGPKNVPPSSKEAYKVIAKEPTYSHRLSIAKNLVTKFPNETAHELLASSKTFDDIYDLRRLLSKLKSVGRIFNPSERKCKVVKRKCYTWRIV